MSDSNLTKVIQLLECPSEGSKPISKKDACAILNIAYNTKRLANIIDEFKDRKAYEASRREKNRGKPAEQHEIQTVVEQYLSGENVTDIAKRLFRTTPFVHAIIEKIGVPVRPTGDDRFVKALLPDACMADSFADKEIAWSAKYHRPCIIETEITPEYAEDKPGLEVVDYEEDGAKMYRIYVLEPIDEEVLPQFASVSKGGRYAYAYAYDLGKLEHLKAYGIDITRL